MTSLLPPFETVKALAMHSSAENYKEVVVEWDISTGQYDEPHTSDEFQTRSNQHGLEQHATFKGAYLAAQQDLTICKISYTDQNDHRHRWMRFTKNELVETMKSGLVARNSAIVEMDTQFWIDIPLVYPPGNKPYILSVYQKTMSNTQFEQFAMSN